MKSKKNKKNTFNALLLNKNAIITGASRGLGREIAKEFVKAGANIVICARNKKEINKVRTELRPFCKKNQIIIAAATDISSEKAAKKLIDNSIAKLGSIQIVVNNAGITGAINTIESVDCNEWKKAIEVNLYGPLYIMHHLLPHFKKQKYGKILNISGGGATAPLRGLSAYAASKTALARLTETIALEVAQYNIDCNSIAPGALNTQMLDQIVSAGPNILGKEYYGKMLENQKKTTDSFGPAIQLCVFLASEKSDGISGKIISAIWDSWQTFPQNRNQIMNSDVFTLRRITPAEKNMRLKK